MSRRCHGQRAAGQCISFLIAGRGGGVRRYVWKGDTDMCLKRAGGNMFLDDEVGTDQFIFCLG